jgi:hypothetical protein
VTILEIKKRKDTTLLKARNLDNKTGLTSVSQDTMMTLITNKKEDLPVLTDSEEELTEFIEEVIKDLDNTM